MERISCNRKQNLFQEVGSGYVRPSLKRPRSTKKNSVDEMTGVGVHSMSPRRTFGFLKSPSLDFHQGLSVRNSH